MDDKYRRSCRRHVVDRQKCPENSARTPDFGWVDLRSKHKASAAVSPPASKYGGIHATSLNVFSRRAWHRGRRSLACVSAQDGRPDVEGLQECRSGESY